MTEELIKINLEFLKRVQLAGAEVPAYVTLVQALEASLKETEESSDDL